MQNQAYKERDSNSSIIFKVNLVGINSVEDLALAFAKGAGLKLTNQSLSLFKSRVIGETDDKKSTDVSQLREMLEIIDRVARTNQPKVILLVDDINAINVDGDPRLKAATDFMLQQFEDWARSSRVRTIMVSSDHTIVDRIPRLHPSNPLMRIFIFSDLSLSEAKEYLKLKGEKAIMKRNCSVETEINNIVERIGTRVLHLRQVAQELNRTDKSVNQICDRMQDVENAHFVRTLENLQDVSGKPLKHSDVIKLVRLLHGAFCPSTNDSQIDWRVFADLLQVSGEEYDFLRPIIPHLINADILAYYDVGTSQKLSMNSKLEYEALRYAFNTLLPSSVSSVS